MAIGNRLSKLWSDLPQCLLELILERLILSDRLRFGSVCRSWRIAQVQCLYPPASQIPFPVFRRNSSIERRSIEFFSLSEKRIYKAPMPDCGTPMHCILCVSSSHGWLLFRTLDGHKSGFLFNPFNRKYIQLPDEISFRTEYFNGTFFCNPITLPSGNFGTDLSGFFFSTPTNPDGVLYVKGCRYRFMLCALKYLPQHSKWIRRLANTEDAVSNTIFCGGNLYALKDDWTLAVINPLSPHNITNVKMRNPVYNRLASLRRDLKDCKYILVESCGEILLVIIHGENCWFRSEGRLFREVFRADLTQMQWVRVQNLDDRILFLTCRTSISICASGTGYKGNRIYYIPTHNNVTKYLELELGTNKTTRHSIPVPDVTMICEWFTPCLFP
ncbi:hypothetical protein MRB53_003852 [Persea americana]|uniref:Uncharacterized protein n=1 Tax=Persea americana TaxID=3435 RepID=A0ACC2MYU0_PERAE|nr:hypothetical protein MRB53_003852 [Persea americana]